MSTRFPRVSALLALFAVAALHAQDEALRDDDIARALEEELQEARAVGADDIAVGVADGVATLQGSVGNVLAKDRAVRIAQMVRGVVAVIDLLEVTDIGRPDSEIAKDIEAAFQEDPTAAGWRVDAVPRDGHVVLTGNVESHAQRVLAERITKSVAGVRGVDNRIAIATGAERSDAEIAADVEEQLRWDARLDDALVNVDVHDGTVELSGSVGSRYDVALASSLAWVQGASSVDATSLAVRPSLRDDLRRPAARDVDDTSVRQAVEKALIRDPRVQGFDVAPVVEQGVVTLTGEVDNLKAKRAAADAARNTVGVQRVMNLIEVRPTILRNDVELGAAVLGALARDPLVQSFDISVDLENGLVTLSGTVNSPFEQMHAADVAARVTGVLDVHNRLSVRDETHPYSYAYYDWDPVLNDFDEQPAGSTRTDEEIATEIEQELYWSPRVDEQNITVAVDDGVATLEGTVSDLHESREATANALEGGAHRVRNRLTVGGQDEP